MKKRVIGIIGCNTFATEIAKVLAKENIDVVIINNETPTNLAFAKEPIIFKKTYDFEPPVYYENKSSKFIGKPTRNFKKR